MESENFQLVKLEPELESSSPVHCDVAAVIKKEEPHNDDTSNEESIPVKLEPGPVISEDSSSFQFESVQKEELDITDEDRFDEAEEEDCPSSSASEAEDSAEEGFDSHADFVLHQRRPKQVMLKRSYKKPFQIRQPRRSHGKSFTCRECNATLASRGEYRLHVRRHIQQKIIDAGFYKCDHCEKAFKSQAALAYHTKKDAGTCPELRAKFVCDQCGRIFFSQILYGKHLVRHQKEAEGKAKAPKKRVKPLSSDGERTVWECEECDKKFRLKNYYHKHQLMHDAIRNAKYKCDVCQKLFSEQRSLDRHVKCVHNKSQPKRDPNLPREPVNCPVCGKTVYEDGLKTHLRYHKYLATGKYACDICKKAFPNKVSLADHQQRKACALPGSVVQLHIEPKIYNCSECDKSFAKQTYLNTHFKRIHENKKQGLFQCKTCKQAFGSKSHLITHELTHAPRDQRIPSTRREPPPEESLNLICSECGKGGFPTRKSVITHLKRVHENKSESKYQCHTCQKIFGSRSNLLAHEQTHDPQHAENRPEKKKQPPKEVDAAGHVCSECGKWLPNRKSLLAHERRVHENKRNGTFQCRSCAKVFGSRSNLACHERCHEREQKERGLSGEEGDTERMGV